MSLPTTLHCPALDIRPGDHLVTKADPNRYGPRITAVIRTAAGTLAIETVNGGRAIYNTWDRVTVIRGVDYSRWPARVYGGAVPAVDPERSMVRRFRDAYSRKYNSPFCAYLCLTDDGTAPYWGNSTDGPGAATWHGGHHVTFEAPDGAVEHIRLQERPVNGVHAYNLIRDAFPDVAAWEDQMTLEHEEALYGHDWHGWRDEN